MLLNSLPVMSRFFRHLTVEKWGDGGILWTKPNFLTTPPKISYKDLVIFMSHTNNNLHIFLCVVCPLPCFNFY